MEQTLSESDKDRIAAFARTPAHRRTPDMLVPESDDVDGEDGAEDA